jgi:hypothetical protein
MKARREGLCPLCWQPIAVGQLIAKTGAWVHAQCAIDRNRATTEGLNVQLTTEQAGKIRQAIYVMDGPAGRPETVERCWDLIGELLALVGDITGITDAASWPMIGEPTPEALGQASTKDET